MRLFSNDTILRDLKVGLFQPSIRLSELISCNYFVHLSFYSTFQTHVAWEILESMSHQ